MKRLLYLTTCIFLINCFQTNLSAQEEAPTVYHVLDYIKVTPGMGADYVKLEKAWKKNTPGEN